MNIDVKKLTAAAKAFYAKRGKECSKLESDSFVLIGKAHQFATVLFSLGLGDDVIDDVCRLVRDARWDLEKSELGRAHAEIQT